MGREMGSPLLTGLMAGGLGYMLGSNAGQQAAPQVQQVMPAPTYQLPQAGPCAQFELRRGDTGAAKAARRSTHLGRLDRR